MCRGDVKPYYYYSPVFREQLDINIGLKLVLLYCTVSCYLHIQYGTSNIPCELAPVQSGVFDVLSIVPSK